MVKISKEWKQFCYPNLLTWWRLVKSENSLLPESVEKVKISKEWQQFVTWTVEMVKIREWKCFPYPFFFPELLTWWRLESETFSLTIFLSRTVDMVKIKEWKCFPYLFALLVLSQMVNTFLHELYEWCALFFTNYIYMYWDGVVKIKEWRCDSKSPYLTGCLFGSGVSGLAGGRRSLSHEKNESRGCVKNAKLICSNVPNDV